MLEKLSRNVRFRTIFFSLLPPLIWVPNAWIIIRHGFNGLYGQDSYAYFDYAAGPLLDHLLSLSPPPPFFWPPGYPFLVALSSLALGPTPLAGQAISLLAGGLVPVFTALLAHETLSAFDEFPVWRASLLAGLLAAMTGQLWQSSIVVMADTTALAAGTVGVWALARYGRGLREPAGPRGRWLSLAAGALAFSVLSRWAYALVGIPAVIYSLVLFARQPRAQAARHFTAAALIALLILSPLGGGLLDLRSTSPGDAPAFAGDLAVYTWNPANAFRRAFHTIDGLLRYDLPNGVYYALAPAGRFYFAPWLAGLIPFGLWAVLRRRTLASPLLIAGWAGAVYAFHAGAPWQNARFTLTYLPPMAILAGAGFEGLRRRFPKGARRTLDVALVAGLAWMAWRAWDLNHEFIERKNADLATARWVEAQVEPGSRILTHGLTLTLRHETALEPLELILQSPHSLTQLLAQDRPTYLLIDVKNIETQWPGRPPGENYRWLQAHFEMVPLGVQQDYTLYWIRMHGP